jgi:tetratricopeptide (TPR) repeat protein
MPGKKLSNLMLFNRFIAQFLVILTMVSFLGLATDDVVKAETVVGPVPSAGATDSLPKGAEEYNKGCELFSIGKLQAGKGNTNGEKQLLKEAQKHFETALVQNPKLVEAQSNIGFISLTNREYHRAISQFDKALLINPKHVNSLNGLATAYALNGDTQKSMQTFDKLLKLSPSNSEFFFNKGSVLQKAGQLSDSKRAYEEAIRIQPKNQAALFNIGTLLENQGNLAAAKVYYERARDVEIGNTAGLEALHRLDAINAALASSNSKSSAANQGKP